MKILVTGTLRAGKTTLLTELANNPAIVVVREVAQDLIDQHGYQVTQLPEFQDMVFAEQLRRETEAEQAEKKFIICDRGTVDVVAFSGIIGHVIKPAWSASLHGRYDMVTIFNMNDIKFDPSEYSVPFDMEEYRAQVDAKIREVLESSGLRAIEISGTHENRLRCFYDILYKLSLNEGNYFSVEGSGHRNGRRR